MKKHCEYTLGTHIVKQTVIATSSKSYLFSFAFRRGGLRENDSDFTEENDQLNQKPTEADN